ncbi:MAG: hypothetical protein J5808_05190 [Paludibacteraceae bacterium]|nr:hypothetical protein [Paludibacteraceae bacterium]
MNITELLEFTDRAQLRQWMLRNHLSAKEVWVATFRKTLRGDGPQLPYLEVVEEALCFGWIDSTLKRLPDGRLAQRLSPRRKNSHWTQLNLQRCHDLVARGLMTESGLVALPSDN